MNYWVCAFCVNQHASICGGFGPAPPKGTPERDNWEASTRDTVTLDKYPVCDCHEQKFFNDQPTACELNKFDDMMAYLFQHVADFSHVIVVDSAFQVFLRAWCVAEIVEGSSLGVSQAVKIYSGDSMDQHYSNLTTLDVRNCRASRKEDVVMILDAIHDTDAFNQHLQWLIFGTEGLFSQWEDGRARAETIGRIVARARTRKSSDDSSM